MRCWSFAHKHSAAAIPAYRELLKQEERDVFRGATFEEYVAALAGAARWSMEGVCQEAALGGKGTTTPHITISP